MASKMDTVDDLTEAQLAHEGIRLILCSQLKEAEAIFSKYRCVRLCVRVYNPKRLDFQSFPSVDRSVSARLHAGHSFTMFIVSFKSVAACLRVRLEAGLYRG